MCQDRLVATSNATVTMIRRRCRWRGCGKVGMASIRELCTFAVQMSQWMKLRAWAGRPEIACLMTGRMKGESRYLHEVLTHRRLGTHSYVDISNTTVDSWRHDPKDVPRHHRACFLCYHLKTFNCLSTQRFMDYKNRLRYITLWRRRRH